MATFRQYVSCGSAAARRGDLGSCRSCIAAEAQRWYLLFLLSGCFCTVSCVRESEDLSVDLGSDGAYFTTVDDGFDNSAVRNRMEFRLAAVGKDRDSYLKNLEDAVTRARTRPAGRGSSSFREKDPVPAERSEFLPEKWMPMVAYDGTKVGTGSFGDVFLAEVSCEAGAEKLMAFKVQKDLSGQKSYADWNADKARWVSEAKRGMEFNHPYLLKSFDSSSLADTGMGVIAMEAAGDGDFKEHFGGYEYKNVNATEVAEYTLQILWGLKYMHDKGLVHADFKAEQVMLACSKMSGCEAKLADFGMVVEGTLERPYQGFQGTLYYLGPEIAAGWGIAPASDMWALGITLNELLHKGQLLFAGNNKHKVLLALKQAYNQNLKSPYVKYVQERNTSRNQLLDGLLKVRPNDRITAESAIELAEQWALDEGVSQDRVKAIMDKGKAVEEGNTLGASALPACWNKCKDADCGAMLCKTAFNAAYCENANHFAAS